MTPQVDASSSLEEAPRTKIVTGDLTVDLLREVFRNLLAWRSLYESDGTDTLTCPDGQTLSLWDVEYLYAASQQVLPIRQRQAICRCLLYNLSEQDAAQTMNIDVTNPVAMYATSGLERLVHASKFGLLPSRSAVFTKANQQKDFASKRRSITVTTNITVPSTTAFVSPFVF